MTDYLAAYNDYLTEVKKSSANTVDSYMRDIKAYISFCSEYMTDPSAADSKFIEKYLRMLQAGGKTPSTVTRTLASIRSFYQYMIYGNIVLSNPTKEVKISSVNEKKLPEILTRREVDLLLSQPDITTHRGCRDKAMLELLYATGIRVSELINLDTDDVNLSISVLHCRSAKSDRTIPVYKDAIKALEDYLARVRPIIVTDRKQRALFLNMNGERLTRQGFWKIIKGYALSAGIDKDITPHTIRHSFATHLLENGAGLKDIKEMLGHSGVSSTAVYTQIVSKKYQSSYNKFHPKAGASK